MVDEIQKESVNFYYVVPTDIFSTLTLDLWTTKWKNKSWINFFVLEVQDLRQLERET